MNVYFTYKNSNGVEFEDVVSRTPNAKSGFQRYLISKNIDRKTCSPVILAKSAVNYFNSTLRKGETPRTFVSITDTCEEIK